MERLSGDSEMFVRCSCDHMTSYGLIMDVSNTEVSNKIRTALLLLLCGVYQLKTVVTVKSFNFMEHLSCGF